MAIETKSLKEWIDYLLGKIQIIDDNYVKYYNPDNDEIFITTGIILPTGVSQVGERKTLVSKNGRNVDIHVSGVMRFENYNTTGYFNVGYMNENYQPYIGDLNEAYNIFGRGVLYNYQQGLMPLLIPTLAYTDDRTIRFNIAIASRYRGADIEGDFNYEFMFTYQI